VHGVHAGWDRQGYLEITIPAVFARDECYAYVNLTVPAIGSKGLTTCFFEA
jgi:hypothetical protein